MNIKTTKKHTIKVQATKLKKNLYSSFVDLLRDELIEAESDFDYFRIDLNRFHDEITSIEKNGFTSSFKDGYTMMLLDSDVFDFVEQWFNKPKFDGEEELEISIRNHLDDEIQIVKHTDLSY